MQLAVKVFRSYAKMKCKLTILMTIVVFLKSSLFRNDHLKKYDFFPVIKVVFAKSLVEYHHAEN